MRVQSVKRARKKITDILDFGWWLVAVNKTTPDERTSHNKKQGAAKYLSKNTKIILNANILRITFLYYVLCWI